jgi:uncharacterized protein
MAEVFADTSGWVTFFVRTEPFHFRANRFMRQWQSDGTQLVTTNYVLSELVALFTSPLRIPRPRLVTTVSAIQHAAWVDLIHVDPALDAEAWTLLKTRIDKEWSLVDCASFAVMHRRAITDALTTDHHFEQAGFVRLLK